MTEDDLDRMIQSSMPDVEITSERLEMMVEGVLLRLNDYPQIQPTLWTRIRAFLPGLAYAVPVVVAAWLGVVTGDMMGASRNADPLISLLSVSSSFDALAL